MMSTNHSTKQSILTKHSFLVKLYSGDNMLYNKLILEVIPKPVFAHIYSCPGYETRLKEKTLPNIEIAYVKKGELKIEIMGREYVAGEGSFLILPRNNEIRIHSSKNMPHIHYTISAITNSEAELKETDEKKENDEIIIPLIVKPFKNTKKCELLLYEAINEFQNPTSSSKIKSGSLVAQLLCELSEEKEDEAKETSKKADILDERIKKYIEKNITSKILLQDIGDALGKNQNYLNQVFKKKNGMPIMAYINLEKMKKVAVLITDKGYSAREAAREFGINDVNYLSRLFKQKMGMSPSQFKSSSADITFSLTDEKGTK